MILDVILACVVIIMVVGFNIYYIKKTPKNLRGYYAVPVGITTTLLTILFILLLFGVI